LVALAKWDGYNVPMPNMPTAERWILQRIGEAEGGPNLLRYDVLKGQYDREFANDPPFKEALDKLLGRHHVEQVNAGAVPNEHGHLVDGKVMEVWITEEGREALAAGAL
jgi:hypothetical protein